jgi:hypothetical protein
MTRLIRGGGEDDAGLDCVGFKIVHQRALSVGWHAEASLH